MICLVKEKNNDIKKNEETVTNEKNRIANNI